MLSIRPLSRLVGCATCVAMVSGTGAASAATDEPIPQLPPKSKALVVRVLNKSRVLRPGAPFRIRAVGVWTDNSNLGIAADVRLGRSITGRRTWPTVISRAAHPYARQCMTGDLSGAGRAVVFISRRRESVEGITWLSGTVTNVSHRWCRRRGPA
jgi:hypothetical protein